MKQYAGILAFLAGIFFLAASAWAEGQVPLFPKMESAAAPEFTFYSGADGKPVKLSDNKGRFVLLHFWATWCAPCIKELPELALLQDQFPKDKFRVIAIPIDLRNAPAVDNFYRQKRIKGPAVYLDVERKAMDAFSLISMPTSLLLDDKGRLIGRLEAPALWQSDEMRGFISNLLAVKRAAP